MKKYFLILFLLLGCLSVNAQEENDSLKLICEKNWEGIEYDYFIMDYAGEGFSDIEVTDEGLAISNAVMSEMIWQPQCIVLDAFSLEEHHDYLVRLTLKVPSDGTYQVVMGSWATNDLSQVPSTAGDDFQIIDFEFPDYAGNTDYMEGLNACHVLLQCGWVVGTTVVKKAQVYERIHGGTTSIPLVKSPQPNDTLYNLAGQKVNTSYKGLVIQNGKVVIK
jgi:hypothetical protein